MNYKGFDWLACVGIFVVLLTLSAPAAQAQGVSLSGVFNDFTPAGTTGPWEVRGHWSLKINGESGKANFEAALDMERSDMGVTLTNGDPNNPASRNAHTHHLSVVDGTVSALSNGLRVSGKAIVTGNGNFPPPFGPNTTVQIDVIGGNTVSPSNIKLTFMGDAATHFGTQPVNGVVRNFP
jgi:hypothetical protein